VAITLLGNIVTEGRLVWKLKTKDGHSLAFHVMQSVSGTLDPKFDEREHDVFCTCGDRFSVLFNVIPICKEPEKVIVRALAPFDWKTVFEAPDVLEAFEKNDFCSLCSMLYMFSSYVLMEDNNDQVAKELLQVLGTCDKLFRKTLHLLDARSPTTNNAAATWKKCGNLISNYLNCLVPIRKDRELENLAWKVGTKAEDNSAKPEFFSIRGDLEYMASLLYKDWKKLERESEQDRWARYAWHNQSPDRTIFQHLNISKNVCCRN